MILERFASHDWKKVEAEWSAGKIGSRECLSRQLALVNMKEAELKALVKEVEVDPAFGPFVKRAVEYGVPLAIVSDGFLTVIREILKRELKSFGIPAKKIPVYSNDIKFSGSKVSIVLPKGAPCEHGCANCKQRLVEKLTEHSRQSIFIGDGLSDRFGAKVSNFTFAKKKLLAYCRENHVPHREFHDFSDIEKWLVENCDPSLNGTKRKEVAWC
jgi:2,3-diketo-5-methylthio-1-phosphopentane phosphatase